MLPDPPKALRRIVRELREERAPFALVGAYAVVARTGVPRTTNDLDFHVFLPPECASKLLYALEARRHQWLETWEHVPTRSLGMAQFIIDGSNAKRPNLDIFFNYSGIEREVVAEAQLVQVAELDLPVATRGHLIALKTLSESDRRNRDRDDVLRLLERATEADLTQAREALDLIHERGFHRGKDLQARLQHFQRVLSPDFGHEL